jgi:hypothetical protein
MVRGDSYRPLMLKVRNLRAFILFTIRLVHSAEFARDTAGSACQFSSNASGSGAGGFCMPIARRLTRHDPAGQLALQVGPELLQNVGSSVEA